MAKRIYIVYDNEFSDIAAAYTDISEMCSALLSAMDADPDFFNLMTKGCADACKQNLAFIASLGEYVDEVDALNTIEPIFETCGYDIYIRDANGQLP